MTQSLKEALLEGLFQDGLKDAIKLASAESGIPVAAMFNPDHPFHEGKFKDVEHDD